MAGSLVAGDKLQALFDGKYYSAQVVEVSTSNTRATAPVKVSYDGYFGCYWLSLDKLKSKKIKQGGAAAKATEATKEKANEVTAPTAGGHHLPSVHAPAPGTEKGEGDDFVNTENMDDDDAALLKFFARMVKRQDILMQMLPVLVEARNLASSDNVRLRADNALLTRALEFLKRDAATEMPKDVKCVLEHVFAKQEYDFITPEDFANQSPLEQISTSQWPIGIQKGREGQSIEYKPCD